jgi:hypothetical protein
LSTHYALFSSEGEINKMTLREQLEYAAKACGIRLEWDGDPAKWQPMYYEGKTYHSFEPLSDPAHSDRMACKLKIDTLVRDGHAIAVAIFNDLTPCHRVKHNNTDEDVCRAVREARMAVAAEIGRAK